MKSKVFFLSMMILGISLLATSCNYTPKTPSSDVQLQMQTETLMQEANNEIGLPAISNFQEKKIMKMIYELRDQESLVCYAYLFNQFTGEVGQYLGRCLGYGLPYSTQFSNPSKVEKNAGNFGEYAHDVVLPQAEPNGLFMPEGLSATWLLLLDETTQEYHPVYIEPEIIVSPFPLHKTKA